MGRRRRQGSGDCRNREPLSGASDQLGLRGSGQEFPSYHAPFRRRAAGIEGGRRPVGCSHFSGCNRHRYCNFSGTIRCARDKASGGHLPHDSGRFDLVVWLCAGYFRRGCSQCSPSGAGDSVLRLSNSGQTASQFSALQRQICPRFWFPAPPLAAAAARRFNRDAGRQLNSLVYLKIKSSHLATGVNR